MRVSAISHLGLRSSSNASSDSRSQASAACAGLMGSRLTRWNDTPRLASSRSEICMVTSPGFCSTSDRPSVNSAVYVTSSRSKYGLIAAPGRCSTQTPPCSVIHPRVVMMSSWYVAAWARSDSYKSVRVRR